MDAPKEQAGDGAGQYDGTGGFLHGGDSTCLEWRFVIQVNPIFDESEGEGFEVYLLSMVLRNTDPDA